MSILWPYQFHHFILLMSTTDYCLSDPVSVHSVATSLVFILVYTKNASDRIAIDKYLYFESNPLSLIILEWKDGCLFEVAGTTPSYVSRVRYARSRGIRKMASPIKHNTLLFFQQMNVHQENDVTMNPAT